MANPRLGLYDGGVVSMFPRRLMNTAVSATLLSSSDFARHIENLLPNGLKAGSGAKRYGVVKKGAAIAGATILEILEFRTAAGEIRILAYCSDGTIRWLNEVTMVWATLRSGLLPNGNPRWTAFNEKLVIVDGINPVMAYDGNAIDDVGEYVTDFDSTSTTGFATAATQVDNNTLTVAVLAGRDDYKVGRSIRVTFQTAGAIIATISAVSGTGTKTIDVTGTPFPATVQTITRVEYFDKPPAFSDIYTEHQRLWALSAGETKAKSFRATQNAMRVYYTDATNNENSWFNQTVHEVGYVNLLNRSRRFDELVRISSINGAMVFFGRISTFIYAGDDPTTLGEFIWQKTLPVGCVNGNLVQKYPADVLFFTRYGARSLQNIFQTEGLEVVADLGSSIDPTVTAFVDNMMTSDALYRAARSYFYERDGFYGFQFGSEYSLTYAISEESKGWVYFSGAFTRASAYLGTSDGRLLMAIGGQLFSYANGTDTGGIAYSDDNASILVKWWTPWLRLKHGRWSNVGYEVLMEEVADTTIDIYRTRDDRDDSIIMAAEGILLTEPSAYWDEAYWDEAYWDSSSRRINVRDKFLADSFGLMIVNESTIGPLSFLGVKPIGR